MGGNASIATRMEVVSTPLLNFKIAGPGGRPSGIANMIWFGLESRMVAVRSPTVIDPFERLEPERTTVAPG